MFSVSLNARWDYRMMINDEWSRSEMSDGRWMTDSLNREEKSYESIERKKELVYLEFAWFKDRCLWRRFIFNDSKTRTSFVQNLIKTNIHSPLEIFNSLVCIVFSLNTTSSSPWSKVGTSEHKFALRGKLPSFPRKKHARKPPTIIKTHSVLSTLSRIEKSTRSNNYN